MIGNATRMYAPICTLHKKPRMRGHPLPLTRTTLNTKQGSLILRYQNSNLSEWAKQVGGKWVQLRRAATQN